MSRSDLQKELLGKGGYAIMGTDRNKRAVGTAYEQKAADYLISAGYQLIEKNYRCRTGEIDLIARDGGYLVFVEVKYRTDLSAGCGAEAVNLKKQNRIRNAAKCYLFEHKLKWDQPCRFDIVSFTAGERTLIKNAF